ncbi:hypothetical protein EGT07_18150 [Herbaspirillum sp. HC18]|nr:hypothetical protein EGT07_18150 [Herbaspirillum sp. HC18]
MITPKIEPPNFCILRVKKLKTMGAVSGSAQHTFREIPTPNAEVSRTHLNVTIGARTSAAVCKSVTSRLPDKRRKDAVLCLEYLITASPEWWKTAPNKAQNDYIKAATQWLQDRHGKENVVCLNMQNDETSPHLVAYIVPRTPDGRLSAKEFVGGPAKLRKMQSDFAEKVGKPVGLQRGVEGSKAEHTTIKKFYAELNRKPELLPPPKPPSPSMLDRLTGKAKQAEDEHDEELRRHAAQVEQARNVALAGKRARDAQALAAAKMRARMEEAEGEHEAAEKLRRENRALRTRVRDLETKLEEIIRWLIELIIALLGFNVELRKQIEAAQEENVELRRQMKRPVSQLAKIGKKRKD